ncbi:MAG TPA: LysM peptidoglycan-binding domain-containing protein [Clostridiales bacterium]|nr:LysM peptidoglycan-binding domain-containing protein [Clostridiales bacterium]
MKKVSYDLKGKAKKIFSLLLVLAMALSLAGTPVFAAEDTDATPIPELSLELGDLTGTLVIIHTNDTHGADVAVPGNSLGTAGIARLVRDYEEAGAEVLLISAGDGIQGDPLVNLSSGKTAINFMNLAGYNMMVPGNHEFDFGYLNLLELEALAKFPIIAANILDKTSGQPVFDENIIFDTSIGKIGVFGLTTPETLTKANPNNVASLTFPEGEAMYKIAQEQVDILKEAGVEYIVGVFHLGIDEGSEPNRSSDVIAKVDGIDIVIDGHSHSIIEGEKYGDTILVSAGTKLSSAGIIILDGNRVKTDLISVEEYNLVDEAVNTYINKVNDDIDLELSETFAKTQVFLDGNRDPGVRTQETNLGDFSADAILWAANEAVGGGIDAAITNGGGIRASIEIGDVTMKDMKTVFPFGNTIATVKVKGAQLIEILEASTYSTPTAVGGFPQVAGIEFTINTGVPYVNGEQFPDSTYYGPANPGTRISNVKIGGEDIDLDKTYTIATNDFLAAGGDTYYLFKKLESHNTYVALEDALVSYTEKVLDGVISKEQYGKPAGRITIIDEVVVEEVEEVEKVEETEEAEEVEIDEIEEETAEDIEETTDEVTYKVVEGDNLWKIAKKQLGSGSRYVEIYELNKDQIKNPNMIYIDQVLVIPAK